MSYDSRPDTKEHICKVQHNLRQIATELTRRGLYHDRSKLESPEVEIFNEFTPKLKESTYGSDDYVYGLMSMGEGLKHHYHWNDHHPEFHLDGIYGMNLIQLMEMLADWKAATERHENGDLAKSIRINSERFGYDNKLRDILMSTAVSLGWI
jgi:hypothetical protein